jgi:murein DD-endopeptidase MepM/ murein hydrolase activator NlpD
MGYRRGKRAINLPLILIFILFAIIIMQGFKISSLNKSLDAITIIDWIADSLAVYQGSSIEEPVSLLTPEFISNTFRAKSPFNDDKTFAELIAEYIKYGRSDFYGSPRRTGDIRRIHEGIDFYVDENAPVYPLFGLGIVTEVSHDPDHVIFSTGKEGGTVIDDVGVEYGKIVRILYAEGFESLYAHLNEIYVEEGQLVDDKTLIGLTGYTGNIRFSGKPSHLHLELRDASNNSFDPENRLHYNQLAIDRFVEVILSVTNKIEDE